MASVKIFSLFFLQFEYALKFVLKFNPLHSMLSVCRDGAIGWQLEVEEVMGWGHRSAVVGLKEEERPS